MAYQLVEQLQNALDQLKWQVKPDLELVREIRKQVKDYAPWLAYKNVRKVSELPDYLEVADTDRIGQLYNLLRSHIGEFFTSDSKIEIFPRHDELGQDEFGNAIRGPLGVHRATRRRYWFYDAHKSVKAQLGYLSSLNKVTPSALGQLIAGLEMPEQFRPKPEVVLPPPSPTRREFRILEHINSRLTRQGKDYRTRCPSCAKRGEDKHGKHLAILIADSRTYRCWRGCTKEEIRAAVGCPIQQRRVS